MENLSHQSAIQRRQTRVKKSRSKEGTGPYLFGKISRKRRDSAIKLVERIKRKAMHGNEE